MYSPHHTLNIFFFVRYFVPMTIFMTPYLIEKKKFSNKDIFNKITPFFFISSLFANLFGPIIISYLGNRNTIIFETFLELICYLIFYFMPPQNFLCARCTGIIHGIVTSLASLTKGIVLEVKPPEMHKSVALRRQAFIKKTCGVLSSWLGQDLKFSTGEHQANLLFSFLTLCISIILCIFIPDDPNNRKKKTNLLDLFLSGNFLGEMRNIYTNEILFFSLLNIVGSTLYISFAMYSAFLFMDRKKDVDPSAHSFSKIMYGLSFPMRYLSKIIVKFLTIFTKTISYNPSYNKNATIFGYIDGIAKIIAAISGYLLTKHLFLKSSLEAKSIISAILLLIFTYSMGITKSLMTSYILFMVGSVCSQASMLWSYEGLSQDKEVFHIILGMNLVVSSIIHIFISYYSKYKKYNSDKKMLVYFYTNVVIILSALLVLCNGY